MAVCEGGGTHRRRSAQQMMNPAERGVSCGRDGRAPLESREASGEGPGAGGRRSELRVQNSELNSDRHHLLLAILTVTTDAPSISSASRAKVAELVDAQDSGSCVRKDVGVRVPPFAPATSLSRARISATPLRDRTHHLRSPVPGRYDPVGDDRSTQPGNWPAGIDRQPPSKFLALTTHPTKPTGWGPRLGLRPPVVSRPGRRRGCVPPAGAPPPAARRRGPG